MNDFKRRDFLKAGAAASGVVLAGAAVANRHPAPRPTSLQYLDCNMYRKNTEVLAHYGQGQHRGGKMQMMAIGERRFLFQQGDVIEITNPFEPVLLGRNAFIGGQLQLAYNNKLGYSSWGSFGMLIHDLSDIAKPRVVGKFLPPGQKPGAIHFHTIDVARLHRGFVIASPEVLNPDCNELNQPIWVIDVKDPANPKAVAKFPVPVPPPEASYWDFCDRRGRFGPHNPPHIKAPGKPHANFTAYSFFNAGLQLFDVADPANPKNTGYFLPPQAGHLDQYDSYPRDTDNVFIEWDRKLMWVGKGTGIYLITSPLLGAAVLKPLKVAEWVFAGLNQDRT